MKKVVKRGLLGIAILLGLALIIVPFRFYVLLPDKRPPAELQAKPSPALVERGEYLVKNVSGCLHCHSDALEAEPGQPIAPNAQLGAGRIHSKYREYPTSTGEARSPNITSSKQFGIGDWTDAEVARAIREGISRDGSPLFQMMPYDVFRHLSDEDTLAIISYLRTLPPVESSPGRTNVKFPVSMIIRQIQKPLDGPVPPPAGDQVSRGNYLLNAALCHMCHDSVDRLHRTIPGYELAGGGTMHSPRGTLRPPNITSDQATGIGSYSDEDLLRAITKGVTKSGRTIYMMPWVEYARMSDEDLRAIIAALRASKPVQNIVPPSELHDPPPEFQSAGK